MLHYKNKKNKKIIEEDNNEGLQKTLTSAQAKPRALSSCNVIDKASLPSQ